jgi:hypothetical protein
LRISKEEWHDWKEHPVTDEFFKVLIAAREEALEQLAHGVYSETPGKQSILIGAVNAFTKILQTEFMENE